VSPTLSSETLDVLRQIDSPTLSNAIEEFRVRDPSAGYASSLIRCFTPQLPPLVGYAVTCLIDSTSPAPNRPTMLAELFDALAAAPKPAVVVMKHVGHDRGRSCAVGDVLSTSFRKLGAAGLVTDGNIRDLSGIQRRAPDFQLFAAGAVVSHGTSSVLAVNVMVEVGGLVVAPGELLHGDENGLLAVPLAIADEAVARARLVTEREAALFAYLDDPSFSLEGLKERLTH